MSYKLTLLISFIFTLSSCGRNYTEMNKSMSLEYLPSDFVSLDIAMKNMEGIMNWWIRDETFGFVVPEHPTSQLPYDMSPIFQTHLMDSFSVLIYQEDIYIHEKLFLEIAEYATNISKLANITYNINDRIHLPNIAGFGIDFDFELISIEKVDVIQETGNEIHAINFELYPIPNSSQELRRLFRSIKSEMGRVYGVHEVVDKGIVYVHLVSGDKITELIVANPTTRLNFEGQNRRIVIE